MNRNGVYIIGIVFCMNILLPFIAVAQNYNYVHYDTKDGLASSIVYDVCQDKNGFIWYATDNGLSRYDGTNFKSYTVKDGLPDNEVLRIFADSKGRVWISTFNKEISYCFKGKLYNKHNDSLVSHINLSALVVNVFEDNAGNIYLVSYKEVLKISAADNTVSYFLQKTFPANLYQEYGYSKYNDRFTFYKNDTLYEINAAGTISDKKYIRKKKIKGFVSSQDSLMGYRIDGNGAWRFNTTTFKDEIHFLPNKNLSRVFTDNEGNTWFGTFGEGVYKLASANIKTIPTDLYTKAKEVFTIDKYQGGIICGLGYSTAVVIENNAITRTFNFEKQLRFSSNSNPTDANRLYCIQNVSSGITMLGFDCYLAKLKNNHSFFSYLSPIKSIDKIDDNNIIVGTNKYVFKISIRDLSITDTIWQERCTKVFYHNNFYYIATLGGLYKVAQDKSSQFLGTLHHAFTRRITDIKVTREGVLWIATSDDGLVAYKNGKVIATITDSNGLSSNICRTLFLHKNYLWIGTNKGLNKINTADISQPVAKYSTADGLPSDIINAIYIQDSTIYVGTPEGLSYFKEAELSTASICKINLLGVSIAGKSMPLDTVYDLSYKNNSITVDYAGVSFKSGGSIIYYYKLSGLNADWQQTTQTSLNYAALPSGKYLLTLYAVNRFGIKSDVLHITINVSTVFWTTWWFYTITIAVLVMLTWWISTKRINKKRLKEQEENNLQKQFAKLEQQALQSQMNPHFIFNCLNSIQQYILTSNKEKANQYLTDFAVLIRQTLEQSDKHTVTVGEEISYLIKYLNMEKMRFGDNFIFEITKDAAEDIDHLPIPAMLLQPYIENCLRHGIRHKTEGTGEVKINFKCIQDVLLCTISDNGIGINKAKQFKSNQSVEYQSKGMSLTAKRIALLNRMNDTHIAVRVSDLEDGQNASTGTVVSITIPVLEYYHYKNFNDEKY